MADRDPAQGMHGANANIPSPLVGEGEGGGPAAVRRQKESYDAQTRYPSPHPSPTRGEGAFARRPDTSAKDTPAKRKRPGDGPALLFGVVVVAAFVGGFGAWAGLAPLDSAAIAPGSVGVDTNRKTVAHLEGGIVARLMVRDYDVVRAGQELIRLDDTQARAMLALIKGRLVAAQALAARLRAERDGAERVAFAPALLAQIDDPEVAQTLQGQVNIFEARRRSIAGQRAMLGRQIGAFEEEIIGLKEQVEAQGREIKLLEEEIKDTDELYQKGLAKKSRMLALQRGLAEIQGSRGQHRAAIARAGERIAEARLRISELETTLVNDAVKELRDAEAQIFDLVERRRAAEDVLARTAIRAPMDGTVVGLRAHTPGGIVGPGAALLDIVPSGERLIIEARIDPNDIDVVQPGLAAQVRVTPFNARGTPPIAARVAAVSADRLADERTGAPYYLARIELEEDPAAALGGAALTPGMPAEVMIATGARTALDYFFRPITRSFNRAFREQ